MNYANILFEIKGGIARLTLHRPDKLNSFTAAMHEEVRDAMTRTEAGVQATSDDSVRVLLLTGAGANLAFACDLVIAKQSASFLQPFCKLGLLPDTGGTYFLPRLVGTARAMGLAMLGDKLPAQQAADWGLIWKCVDDDTFAAEIETLLQHLVHAPTLGLARTKQAIYAGAQSTLEQQLQHEREAMSELGRSRDYREGVDAFLNKRPPVFRGR